MSRWWFLVATLTLGLLTTRGSRAETQSEVIQAPVGGRPVPFGAQRVMCGSPPADWSLEPGRTEVRPPTTDDAIGRVAEVRIAATESACATASVPVALVAIGRAPTTDSASVVLWVDEGRVDVRGHGLRGSILHWRDGASADAHAGEDRCATPQVDGAWERCSFVVGRSIPADPLLETLFLFPAGSRVGNAMALFDVNGRKTARDDYSLRPSRLVLNAIAQPGASIDLGGQSSARVTLVHPEAVTSVDCGSATCDVEAGAVVFRSLPGVPSSIPVRVRLAPRVFFQRAEAFDTTATLSVPVLPCAMAVLSGNIVRNADDAKAVVRVDGRCSGDPRDLHFSAAGRPAEVERVEQDHGASLLLLSLGRVDATEVTITAMRGSDSATVGQVRARTEVVPAPRAILELEGGRAIDFIPTNRPALVKFAQPSDDGRVALRAVDGVYRVGTAGDVPTVQGERAAAGFVALRFAYRVSQLPPAFAGTDLATFAGSVDRPIHEAAVPAQLTGGASQKDPIAEVLCGAKGAELAIPLGKTTHVPFRERDTCHVVFHRERLRADDGPQRLSLEVEVARLDGTPRAEARVAQPLVLRPSQESRVVWVHGASAPFDRITVRLSEVGDDSWGGGTNPDHGDGATTAAQWSVVTGTGRARVYATTAIPTGLYRVSDSQHSGILTLNFGAIARLTWLDTDGTEGFLGFEGGVMGVGLANDVSSTGRSLTQVATVAGIGLSVPIANRSLATETSINLHAWAEYEVSRALGNESGSPFGFVFGPSISIGNIGANL